jgi:hypothetical protein
MLRFFVEWAPRGASPTLGELLKYFVEALRAFGWETIWTEQPYEPDDRARRVYRPERAEELMSARVPVMTHPSGPYFLLQVYTMGQGLPDGRLKLLTPLPVAGRAEDSPRPRLYAGAPIPGCTRDEATRILRRLVHLSAPRFAAVGVAPHTEFVVPTLLYLDSTGRSWLEKNAAHVKLSVESTGGAWVVAHGEALTSETDHARDANRAMQNTFERWYEETSKPTAAPAPVPTGAVEPAPGAPGTASYGPSTAVPETASFDPDVTVPPTPFLGRVLPFAMLQSSDIPPVSPPASPQDQSGDTVAVGELPLLVRGFSLPRYARLRAALSRHGEEHTPTLAAFGLDVSSKQALQHAFVEVFQSRPDLVSQFTQLVALAKLRQGDHG